MKSLIKPYSLLLYFLVIIVFFFLGVTYAGITDAGKNQGLAGGAIVLGYGVISSFFALLMAFFIAFKSSKKTIVVLNKVFGLMIVGFIVFFTWRYYTIIKPKRELQQQELPAQPKQTSSITKPMAMLIKAGKKEQHSTIGLGMFSPNISKNEVLYFYGNLNLEKSIMEHSATDSITFKKNKYGSYDIATAPPWLVPDHLKLDNDMLYFKTVSITADFIEVIVNTTTNQTAFVDKRSGTLQYWPEFLLGVNSVEFINVNSQKIFVKPLDHAGIVNSNFSFMKPLKIKQNWMYVLLLNDSFKETGKGWIKWQEKDKLLITYNLLS